jgi:hypothetical protein
MPVFTKGSFSINLGFVSVGGDFDEQDRQCAWEFDTEITSPASLLRSPLVLCWVAKKGVRREVSKTG